MNADRQSFYAVPENRELSAQYLLLYEMSLPYGLDLNDQLNVDKSESRLIVTLTDVSTAEMQNLRARAMELAERQCPRPCMLSRRDRRLCFLISVGAISMP